MIGFNRRFDPSFRSLRERLGAGEIGVPELVIITSRDPAPPPVAYIKTSGGIFRDMTIHDFDMARYLLGDILELQAFGANLVDPAIGAIGDIDTAMLVLRATSGALVHIDNQLRVVPELAESIDHPDALTYVAHIRKGVLFHNGRELTSADVVYTFRSFLDPTFKGRSGAYRVLASVNALTREEPTDWGGGSGLYDAFVEVTPCT